MEYYDIETKKGDKVRCYEVKGIYYPLYESGYKFIGEPIKNIELIDDSGD